MISGAYVTAIFTMTRSGSGERGTNTVNAGLNRWVPQWVVRPVRQRKRDCPEPSYTL